MIVWNWSIFYIGCFVGGFVSSGIVLTLMYIGERRTRRRQQQQGHY